MKKHKITVTPEVLRQLVDELELRNRATVYHALNYTTDSPTARLIRRRALELGGILWTAAGGQEREQ